MAGETPELDPRAMDLNFEERMAAISDMVLKSGIDAPTQSQPEFADLVTMARTKFYTDYSLWDAEFDIVERVINRAISERP